MAEITASMVKALRDETGLGMMDCKKALAETDGDVEAAKDILRKKGLATAEKKADRATSEGLIRIASSDDASAAAMVEILCETDFCARNDVFQAMAQEEANLALDQAGGAVEATEEMEKKVQDVLAKIGENMSFSRGVKLVGDKVGAYLHHNGKVGVLVAVEGEIDDDLLQDVCMHVAFSDPMGVTPDDIPEDMIAREKEFAKQEAIDSGKPEEIAEKIVSGKIRKFLEERALLEQQIAREDKYGKKQVKELLGDAKILAFARYAVGSAG